nr:hypothetical protein [uncultured Anaerostipes sp.]
MINMDNFDSPSFDIYDICLVQKEVDGGTISTKQIDTIRNFPDSKSIIISGLKQDTFEYFINTYGRQFRAITFWKNKAVSDLSALSLLNNIEYISYFFNQRASELWDMTKNRKLVGLSLSDFSRLHSLKGIEKAHNLTNFYLYNRVEAKMEIESLKPIVNTSIKHFTWGGKRVLDNNYKCLSNSKIEVLDINPTQFTLSELAQLLALFPDSLKGSITKPYTTGKTKDKDGYKEYFFLCKRKKRCIKGKDDKRFASYLNEFENLLKKCKENNVQ